jgi:pyruvate-ferredoxin/flavodoxin oxidoreductase
VDILTEVKASVEPELQETIEKYLAVKGKRDAERMIVDTLVAQVKASKNAAVKALLDYERDLVSNSVWIIGGDGWAYDIGFGGLDHVLANNLNVNVLIVDTEVYSNTGGQSSKASQAASIAKFAAGGKPTGKKDIGQIAMVYGHVYVASVAMGANRVQTIKAFKEAEGYDGPSLIIAYAPCIEHGIKGGMMNHQATQKKAVECGYWPLYRFNPTVVEKDPNANPLTIDYKTPDFNKYRDFIMTETRFSQIENINPEHAEELINKSRSDAEKRFTRLTKLAKLD